MMTKLAVVFITLVEMVAVTLAAQGDLKMPLPHKEKLELIRPNKNGKGFIGTDSGARFIVWGVNYDHDDTFRQIEEYWVKEWSTVMGDFKEMKELGANVVRIHLQLGKFMESPTQPNLQALQQLAKLVKLAEDTGLYLDITGLACYHKYEVPSWYDKLSEAKRWDVQARFWAAVAKVGAKSHAIFCYDLMNEPLLPDSEKQKMKEWVTGQLGHSDFFYTQFITLDLDGRSQEQVAKQWVDKLAGAIRNEDRSHMITLGVIPWGVVFPKAEDLFYTTKVSENLDYASVHFYPKSGRIDKDLAVLATYSIGKPIVVEEMAAMDCSIKELDQFVEGSRKTADGWIGFYWGKTIAEYTKKKSPRAACFVAWLKYFHKKAPQIVTPAMSSQK